MSGWKRTVRDLDGTGQLGVNIPAEYASENGIEVGSKVAIREPDDTEGVLELHFKE